MSVARTFRVLELFDVLSNLIPGGILILTPYVLFSTRGLEDKVNPVVLFAAFLLLAYVFGHIVQYIASRVLDTPTLFQSTIEDVISDSDDSRISVSEVEGRFWEYCKSHFELSEDFDDYEKVLQLILSYLETTPATRALRFQALYSFSRNMYIVSVVGIVASTAALAGDAIGLAHARSVSLAILVLLLSVVMLLVFRERAKKFEKKFIEYTIFDFYNTKDRG